MGEERVFGGGGNLKDFARPRCSWLGGKRMGLVNNGLSVVVRIRLAQDRYQRQPVVNLVMNV